MNRRQPTAVWVPELVNLLGSIRYMAVRRALGIGLFAVVSAAAGGCASTSAGSAHGGGAPAPAMPPATAGVRENAVVHVQDHWLLLHLSRAGQPAPDEPLVLYITGDGGWGGKDLDTWEHLQTWRLSAAGFSAPDYLGHLRGGASTLPPRALARDIAAIASTARAGLGLPSAVRVVLVGVSRGADLAVVAAAQPALRRELAGVLAIALTDEEEYLRRRRHRLFGHGDSAPGEDGLEMVRPFDYLSRIDAPLCLIQSTNDGYVPAARARQQFGPESSARRFVAIESRNHSFSDARDALYRAMHASFSWLERAAATAAAAGHADR